MEFDTPVSFVVPEKEDGVRLDAALQKGFPALGLRARRRLWEWCIITVNGKKCAGGHRVAAGDTVVVAPATTPLGSSAAVAEEGGLLDSSHHATSLGIEHLPVQDAQDAAERTSLHGIRLLDCFSGYAALYKPAGIHSAIIKGSRETSAEALIQQHWPLLRRNWQKEGHEQSVCPETPPILVTRLDNPTSGLLLAVTKSRLVPEFRAAEAAGHVKKEYAAFIWGCLETPLYLTKKLLTADRVKTGIASENDPDPSRHTLVEPLWTGTCTTTSVPVTLVRATILRGARHQIRAHLSSAGFPLVGDALYGQGSLQEKTIVSLRYHGENCFLTPEKQLYLHHFAVSFLQHTVYCPPCWGDALSFTNQLLF